MSFIEGVYISHILNTNLGRMERQGVIERAVEVCRFLRELAGQEPADFRSPAFATAYRRARILCPLNEFDECLIFENRPLACRLFDLPAQDRQSFLAELPQRVNRISNDLYFAFTSRFPGELTLDFPLSEVVSGKFVQTFFHYLLK